MSDRARTLAATLFAALAPTSALAVAVRLSLARRDPEGVLVAALDPWLGLALLGALALGALVGTLVARGAAARLRRLEETAARIAAGDASESLDPRERGELGDAQRAFDRMRAELHAGRKRLLRAERIAAWRDIAQRIAHEIKNPLMPIQTSIETMRKTHERRHPDFDEIFEESTATVLEEVERLKRIVGEFSRFARLPRPRPSEVAVEEVAQHVVGLFAGGETLVTMEVQGQPPRVRADREQLTQVLLNLVQNASDAAKARHGTSDARAHVLVCGVDEGVRVEVVDNGPGIPESERAVVFEPYYTTKPHGTGLGLAITHRIVTEHGGRIDIDEAEGGGAVLEVILTREGPAPELEGSQTDRSLPRIERSA
jgi:nitrogen fixation/metabolism regulation signal transduction histidine kinase